MHKFAVGVFGASGYAGRELCELVARHPAARLAFATAGDREGTRTRFGGQDVTFVAAERARLAEVQLVFSALPHGASAPWVRAAHEAGAKVVDLSADLRPGTASEGALRMAAAVPYGLTELARDRVRGAEVVANPGCYPTVTLLALLPLLARGLVAPGATITVNAASGVTGAGFTPTRELMFAEVEGNFRPYAIGNEHRHLAEMRAVLASLDCDADLIFTPHLLPVARGILATIAVPLVAPLVDALAPWREHFAGEPFIEVSAEIPSFRDVVHRNVVRITAIMASGVRVPTVIIVAAIDNLVKGAAGQALQNANLLLGLEETMGLPV
ncbi:MAG: N-acetyl-gamma-glutamyl-phosphate reductase [Gemmatimonadota bacterium]|nr:N-acetyl-gamma-glutamyl-phosphate reductase [Gemmatimonadota bacterium]